MALAATPGGASTLGSVNVSMESSLPGRVGPTSSHPSGPAPATSGHRGTPSRLQASRARPAALRCEGPGACGTGGGSRAGSAAGVGHDRELRRHPRDAAGDAGMLPTDPLDVADAFDPDGLPPGLVDGLEQRSWCGQAGERQAGEHLLVVLPVMVVSLAAHLPNPLR